MYPFRGGIVSQEEKASALRDEDERFDIDCTYTPLEALWPLSENKISDRPIAYHALKRECSLLSWSTWQLRLLLLAEYAMRASWRKAEEHSATRIGHIVIGRPLINRDSAIECGAFKLSRSTSSSARRCGETFSLLVQLPVPLFFWVSAT